MENLKNMNELFVYFLSFSQCDEKLKEYAIFSTHFINLIFLQSYCSCYSDTVTW